MSSTTSTRNSSDTMQNSEMPNSKKNSETEEIQDKTEVLPYIKQDVFSYTAANMTSFCIYLKGLKIEVVMFMYMFFTLMRHVSTTTIIMDKVCTVHLNFLENECNNLAIYPDKKLQMEKLSNNYIVGHNMIQTLPACIIAAFIGAWSDKYGRKIPLIIAITGVILDGIGMTICAAVPKSRVEFVLLSAAFTGFSGGAISAMTVIYSYTTDISTSRQRTLKYAIMEVVFGLSYPLGQLAGGWLYLVGGYIILFLTSTGGYVFSLAWVIFVLKETRGLDNVDSWSVKLKDLFSFKSVIEGMKATVKSRPNNGRKKMLLLILGLTMTVLSYSSASNINFLYVHHQYDWDNTTYSTVASTFSIIGIFLMLIAVPVFKHFNLGDVALGIVGNVSLLAKNVTIGFSVHPGLYYLAQALGLLVSLGTLAARSSISKVVSKDDIGKVFSFITTSESLLHVITAAVVSQFFNATLHLFPGLVFFGAAGLLLIPISVFIWLGRQPSIEYEEMHMSTQKEGDMEANVDNKELEEK